MELGFSHEAILLSDTAVNAIWCRCLAFYWSSLKLFIVFFPRSSHGRTCAEWLQSEISTNTLVMQKSHRSPFLDRPQSWPRPRREAFRTLVPCLHLYIPAQRLWQIFRTWNIAHGLRPKIADAVNIRLQYTGGTCWTGARSYHMLIHIVSSDWLSLQDAVFQPRISKNQTSLPLPCSFEASQLRLNNSFQWQADAKLFQAKFVSRWDAVCIYPGHRPWNLLSYQGCTLEGLWSLGWIQSNAGMRFPVAFEDIST